MFPTNNGMRRVKSAFAAIARFAVDHRLGASLTAVALLMVGSIVPLVGQSDRDRGEGKYEHDSAEQIRKRSEWFFHQRAFPLGHIPAGARLKAFQQVEQMRRTKGVFMKRFAAAASERSIGPSIAPNTSTWTSIGPQPTASAFFGPVSGRVNALAVDPCDATGNTIYAGAAQGGVWKSTSGGTNWTPLTDSQLSISSGSLAVDPNLGDCTGGHTGAIYYGTGEENFAFDSFYGAGVLISHDGGVNWTKDNTFVNVTSGTPSVITPESATAAGPFIGAISVDPATSGTSQVLLAAVQGISTQAHSGIWRSTDGGADWTLIPATSYSPALPAQFDFGTGVAFDPNDPTGRTAYAALGIPFCTGANNTCDQSGSPELDNGVYKSTDGGMTWTLLASLDTAVTNAGLAVANYGRITIAVGPSATLNDPAKTELVISIANIAPTTSTTPGSSADLLGIFKSTDGGQTFAPITTPAPFCNDQCFYDMAVGISPTNANVIFLGGGPAAVGRDSNGNSLSSVCGQFLSDHGISTVIRSTDGGQTWADASCDNASGTFIHVDTHAFAFAPGGTVYTGNDGGVWSSANVISGGAGSQTWSNLNNSLSLTQFYPGNSIHPSNPQIGFAGAQDNGMQMFTGQPGWSDTNSCGDGGWTAIDPSTPSTVYTTCEAIGQVGTLLKNQEDGTGVQFGANWIALDTPAIDKDNTDFVPPLVLDPTTPQNVYFGTDRVWQSTNGGLSWTAISTILPSLPSSSRATCGGGLCVITTLAVAPNSSSTVYVGADTGQIFDSTNATGAVPTFNEIDKSNMPQRTVTQVSVSPTNSQIAFATFSGFSSCSGCDGLGHVFMTLNGGGAWTKIDGNLPDTPVNDVVVDPTPPNGVADSTLYVATDVGVFVTTTGGVSWSELASGLPHVECTSLKLNNTARVLRVGTHGRGDWDLQLPGLPGSALTGISPTSTTAGAAGFTLTLNGVGLPSNPTVNFGSTALSSSGSGSQITVAVPAAAVTGSGVVLVSVAGAQNSLNFSIEGPVPILKSISPPTAKTGANITLTVNGSNFNSSSEVVWTPSSGSGVNVGISTVLPQLPGGTSTSFTVTVPASLLTSSLARTIPVVPGAPKPKGPGAFWLLAAFCTAILGILMLAAVPRKRRLVFGTTLTTVLILLLIGGCSGVGSSNNPPPPPPPGNSVKVGVNAYNPAPGGGISAATGTITVSQ
ncbi:MAG: WD40/YVTN/BNR-like repeat-containing protein [Candidatus Acidiferrales bacterium]